MITPSLTDPAPPLLRILAFGGAWAVALGMIALAFALHSGAANPPHSEALPLNEPIQNSPFTLELSHSLSHPDDVWGIWLSVAPDERLVVALNGYAYVTARLCPMSIPLSDPLLRACPPLIEPSQGIATDWKSFPHLHKAGQSNSLRLYYPAQNGQSRVELRLNEEWMWNLPFTFDPAPSLWGKFELN